MSNRKFSSNYNIKYNKALFIRYLNESEELTLEQIEILANKYKMASESIKNLFINQSEFKDNKNTYHLFINYLDNLEFNRYAMFEIILACKAYYYDKDKPLNYDTSMVNKIYKDLFKKEKAARSLEKEYCEVLKNHELTELIRCGDDDYYYTNIGKNYARNELITYSKIYGNDKVNKIKEYVKRNHR